ncbi:MAG: EAL domain-containing protein [Rickettsiales bacterium]
MNEAAAFFSIWTQDSPYWLVVEGASDLPSMQPVHHKSNLRAVKTAADWRGPWRELAGDIKRQHPGGLGHRGAVIAGDALPGLQEIELSLREFRDIEAIATNLWLVDDVNHGRLGCYMQRVLDRRDKIVGYEAFARMEGADGGVIGGGAIMQAATALRMEFQLDRLLHKQAIESFVEGDLDGYIFINFLTGFIHRPEVYLDGLSQAVSRFGMRAGSIVLDVPIGDYAHDLKKLKSIAEYCRARGFALALDDVHTADHLSGLLEQVRPAFVKLDGKASVKLTDPKRLGTLQEIVRLSHGCGASVLAEGVENKPVHDAYLSAGVDMFQGYHFGAPERFPKLAELAARAHSS